MTKVKLTPICPYCKSWSRQVLGNIIYPHRTDLHKKVFYECSNCDAYVGCHPDTNRPLGRLANKELRAAKSAAHRSFDRLWRYTDMSRGSAYKWLQRQLNLSAQDCHIGMFDIDTCNKVVLLTQENPFDDET